MRQALALLLFLAALPASAETILVVGDSHTAGSFGRALDDALRAAPGNLVATYGVCSARPQSYFSETPHSCGFMFRGFDKKAPAKWLGARVYKDKVPDGKGGTREVEMVKTPELGQLLRDHSPTVVVVALGSNMPTSASSINKTLEAVHKAGAACFWIGPPNMRRPDQAAVADVYATLRDNKVRSSTTLADARQDSCRLIDSLAFSYLLYPDKGGDGTHYEGTLSPLGARWGGDAANSVLSALRQP